MLNLKRRYGLLFLASVLTILSIFLFAGTLFAKSSNYQTVRVGLVTDADKIGFKVNVNYQLIDKKSEAVIAVVKPGEHWELTTRDNEVILSKKGNQEAIFSGSLFLLPNDTSPINVISAIKTTETTGSKLAAVNGKGEVTELDSSLTNYHVVSAKGTSQITGGTNELGLISLESSGVTKRYRGNMEFKISSSGKLMAINELSVEEYLYAVVPSEMPVSFGLEALKAQTLAARTYALRAVATRKNADYQLAATDASQVYGGYNAESPVSTKAVQDTVGEVITCQGELIDAVFFSSSGGFTDNSEEVWKNYLPYLRWKKDPYDINDKHYNWVVNYTPEQLTYQVNQGLAKMGYTEVFERILALDEVARTSSGARLRVMKIHGYNLDGSEITVELTNADRVRVALGLKSSLFTFEQMKDDWGKFSGVNITGSGWGHGIGMSQYGARGMSEQGYNYREILKYYYTDVDIVPDYGQ